MNTADMIYQKSKALPEAAALEVLDFIAYLEHKTLKNSPFRPTDVEQGLGCAGYTGETKSLAEMEQAIADNISREWRTK